MDSATSSPKSLLRTKLTGRISKDEVCELCRIIKGNDEMKAALYGLTTAADVRTPCRVANGARTVANRTSVARPGFGPATGGAEDKEGKESEEK